MNVSFPFKIYYQQNFVDPLYAQYKPVSPLSRPPTHDVWFEKRYAHWPCPDGFDSVGSTCVKQFCSMYKSSFYNK